MAKYLQTNKTKTINNYDEFCFKLVMILNHLHRYDDRIHNVVARIIHRIKWK